MPKGVASDKFLIFLEFFRKGKGVITKLFQMGQIISHRCSKWNIYEA
ncbi:hypothetical protein [Persephonella sp.]|nr:hypothetical protein [Persephonella sp.]